MELKEFLLEGGSITFPYKENKKDWVSEVRLHLFNGFYSLPKVFIESPTGLQTFPLENIDVAISCYIDTIFSEKNLYYKMSPTLREFNLREDFVDLDNDDDMERVEKARKFKFKK